MDDNIYSHHPRGLSTLVKGLTAATYIMESSSNELGTPVGDSIKYIQTKCSNIRVNLRAEARLQMAEWYVIGLTLT